MARRRTDRDGGDELMWVPAADPRLTVRGLWWFSENGGGFSRLPLRARDVVRPEVWALAQQPASARVCFRTDTTRLAVSVTNAGTEHMQHMPASGSGGLCLYAGEPYRQRPWAVAIPDADCAHFERELFRGVPAESREFALYLPLYNALEALEIGVDPGAGLWPPSKPALERPAVFYGTSITQGGCASLPGSDFVSSVGRMLNLDVVNLGFSGNGRGDVEIARLMAEIDAAIFVLDYAANCDAQGLRRTLPPFYEALRERHPETPILLISSVIYWQAAWNRDTRRQLEAKRDAMMRFHFRVRRSGDPNVHYLDGAAIMPTSADATFVDGVHPTDHGFQIMAERLAPVIETILFGPA